MFFIFGLFLAAFLFIVGLLFLEAAFTELEFRMRIARWDDD